VKTGGKSFDFTCSKRVPTQRRRLVHRAQGKPAGLEILRTGPGASESGELLHGTQRERLSYRAKGSQAISGIGVRENSNSFENRTEGGYVNPTRKSGTLDNRELWLRNAWGQVQLRSFVEE